MEDEDQKPSREPVTPRLEWLGDRLIAVPITCGLERPGDDYDYALTFDVVAGQLSCREVRVIAREGGPEVKRSVLAGIAIDDQRDLVAATVTLTATATTAQGVVRFSWPTPGDNAARAANLANLRATRRRTDTETLRRVADIYLANETAPTEAVRSAFGVAHRTASLYVQRARQAGLLPAYRNSGSRQRGDAK